MNIQGWSPLGLTGLISWQYKARSRVFSSTTVRRSAFFTVQLSHPYMTTGKTVALTRWTFVGKVTSLLFNMLSRFVMVFHPRSKYLLISWLQSPSAVILELKKIKSISLSISISHCVPIYLPWSNWTGSMILVFGMISFKPAFLLSSFTFIKRLSNSSLLSALRVVSSAYLRLLIFIPANLDSSLRFSILPSILDDIFCIYVKEAGCQYTAFMYSSANFEPVHCSMSSFNCCFLTCIQVSQEAGKVSGICLKFV